MNWTKKSMNILLMFRDETREGEYIKNIFKKVMT